MFDKFQTLAWNYLNDRYPASTDYAPCWNIDLFSKINGLEYKRVKELNLLQFNCKSEWLKNFHFDRSSEREMNLNSPTVLNDWTVRLNDVFLSTLSQKGSFMRQKNQQIFPQWGHTTSEIFTLSSTKKCFTVEGISLINLSQKGSFLR